jgi:peptidoglycan/LPS O-acetylase OafA/YrhL
LLVTHECLSNVRITVIESSDSVHSWRRLDGVDLLRGAAIFFVLMNHVNMRLLLGHVPYGQAVPRQVLSTLVWSAQYGVQMFFAVSGFLITSTSLRRWGSPAGVRPREFYLLRFARIAPLLIVLLAILVALHCIGLPRFVVPARTGGLGTALFAALTFHINVLEAHRGYLPGNWDVLWSLSVEEVFYVFFPIVCLWLGRGRWLILLLIALMAIGPFARTILAGQNEVWQEYSYLGGMDAIAMGCLTALAASRIHLSRGKLIAARAIGASLVAFILGFSILVEEIGLPQLGLDMTVIALGACLVMATVAQAPRRLPMTVRPLLWLGRRSYEIYLTHMFVVISLYVIFTRFGAPSIGVPALFIATVLLSGLLGEFVARFYSEPMNRYLRRRWDEGPGRLGSVLEASVAVDAAPSSRSRQE